jgi:general stress protein YciG
MQRSDLTEYKEHRQEEKPSSISREETGAAPANAGWMKAAAKSKIFRPTWKAGTATSVRSSNGIQSRSSRYLPPRNKVKSINFSFTFYFFSNYFGIFLYIRRYTIDLVIVMARKEVKGEISVREQEDGGSTTKENGPEFYRDIGHKGGQKVRELIERGKSAER